MARNKPRRTNWEERSTRSWWDGPGWRFGGQGNNVPRPPVTPPTAPPATTPPTTPPAGGPEDTEQRQSAWAYMQQLLDQAGLGSLGSVVQNLISTGMTDPNQLQLELQNTQEWKQRFAGNEALKQAGLGVLSVAEYLATERTYAQVMKNAGLPEGFYDDPSDFAKYIGNNVSPNELQQRVTAWTDLAHREDPAIRAQLRAMGISDGDLAAYMMDPERAAPLIQKTYQSALIGGAARRQGLDAGGIGRLVDMGITEREAIQGFGVIAENLADAQRLGSIYGEETSQRDLEAETFQNDGAAIKKRKRLASRERANFQGSSGVGQGSLSRRDSGNY